VLAILAVGDRAAQERDKARGQRIDRDHADSTIPRPAGRVQPQREPRGAAPALGPMRSGRCCRPLARRARDTLCAPGQGTRPRGGSGSARAAWRWTAFSRRGMVEAPGATREPVGRAGGRSVRADLRLA